MIISLIVAVSRNGVIGLDNQLPWHLPSTLQYELVKTCSLTCALFILYFFEILANVPPRVTSCPPDAMLTHILQISISATNPVLTLLTALSFAAALNVIDSSASKSSFFMCSSCKY